MQLNSDSMRDFLSNFTNFEEINLDLETLVKQYRLTKDPRKFATIYNKVLGAVLNQAKKAHEGLCDQDIFSHGMEALVYCLRDKNGWNENSKVKFLTYFYRTAHNVIYTLQKKKYFRDLNKYETSLDEMVDNPDSNFDVTEEQRLIPSYGGFYPKSELEKQNEKKNGKKRINSLMYDFEEVVSNPESKASMAMTMGISLTNLEIELLKLKIRRKFYSESDKESIISDKIKLNELKRIQRQQRKATRKQQTKNYKKLSIEEQIL